MSSSEKLSGETLLVRHIPLAHGQSVGCQLFSPVQRPRRPCFLSLTHSNSLPEKDELPKVALDLDFLSTGLGFPCYSSKSSSNNESESVDHGAINTRVCDSSPTHLSLYSAKMELTGSKGTTRWQNPFLPEVDGNEDEDDDDDGDNMHKYREGSSIRLHGNLNWTQNEALGYTTETYLQGSGQCMGSSPEYRKKHLLFQAMDLYGTPREHKLTKSLSDSGLQQCRDSKETPVLMDCEEPEWKDEEHYDEYVLREKTFKKPEGYKCVEYKSFSECETSNQNQTDYVSDSSCNSSDGVLVNFSAIYNRTNNAVPAIPHDLDSPANQPHGPGSMTQSDDFIRCRSPCGIDPNCNIYPLDSDILSSLEISDLTACLQSQAQLMTSTQNYYKLVTCDLSSQSSPSPAWSSVTSYSETHSHGSLTPPTEYFLFQQPGREEGEGHLISQRDLEVSGDKKLKKKQVGIRDLSKATKAEKTPSKTQPIISTGLEPNSHEHPAAAQSQSWDRTEPCDVLPEQATLTRVPSYPYGIDSDEFSGDPTHNITSFAELARYKKCDGDLLAVKNSMEVTTCSWFFQNTSSIQGKPPVAQNVPSSTKKSPRKPSAQSSDICEPNSEGASSPEMVRYTKAQRPTSLPIQPFILQPPSGKRQSRGLGSLLHQYISHKHGKVSKSKCTSACRGLANHVRPLPLGSYCSIHLEGASSSDTCSTCTPSPIQPHTRPHCHQPSPLLVQNHPEQEQKSRSPKTIDLWLSEKSPKACVSPHHDCFPTMTSVTSLTPLSKSGQISLHLSEAAEWNQTKEQLDTTAAEHISGPATLPCFMVNGSQLYSESFSLTDKPPEEFCPSPETSTQFLSFNLIQKRGMLKSLSSAVDLITAHFHSCRDPEEKVRLGNSPSISQLVLSQLCPVIQNILQDGLRAFKLDLIVGQRRNKPWIVVEASTRPGPSTRMLQSLVSVIKRCSHLTNHSMRLNAFFLGLLNYRELESWFLHLHTCVDIISEYYHPWAFLALSQGPACTSLFQKLIHLLKPLSHLPFDLHLLSELRLLRRQDWSQQPPQSFKSFALSAYLQMPSNQGTDRSPGRPKQRMEDTPQSQSKTKNLKSCSRQTAENLRDRVLYLCNQPKNTPSKEEKQPCHSSVWSERQCAQWWLSQTPISDGVKVGVCSDGAPHGNQTMLERNSLRVVAGSSMRSEDEKSTKELRWARLFGSGIRAPAVTERAQQSTGQTQRTRLPSQWLRLGASKVDLLAQAVWGETGRALCQWDPKSRHTHSERRRHYHYQCV